MKIVVTPPASGNLPATPFVLGDDSVQQLNGTSFPNGAGGLVKPGFLPDLTVATQRDELIGAPYLMETPRGNAQLSYTFSVWRSMATPDQALMFLADHPAAVPITGTVAVYIGGTVRYLKNAVLKSVRATEHANLGFMFSYTYAGSYAPAAATGSTGSGGPFSPS